MRDGTEKEEREGNLPQWAQQKLDLCRRRLAEARADADALGVTSARNPRDNVWLEQLGAPALAPYMPSQWRTARFYVNDDRDSWIEVRRSSHGPTVEVRGNGMIMALPSSSNVLEVAPIDDYIDRMPRHIEMSVEALKRRRAGRGRLE